MTAIVHRHAVRAIVLNAEREVLLMRIQPVGGDRAFWITPGGGLEDGETPDSGLRRELQEELGLADFAVGPLVWRREHTFDWDGRRICQHEEFHVVEVPGRFEAAMTDPLEMRVLKGFRWWPLGELASAEENIAPVSLGEIVQRFLTEGAPREIPATEILVD